MRMHMVFQRHQRSSSLLIVNRADCTAFRDGSLDYWLAGFCIWTTLGCINGSSCSLWQGKMKICYIIWRVLWLYRILCCHIYYIRGRIPSLIIIQYHASGGLHTHQTIPDLPGHEVLDRTLAEEGSRLITCKRLLYINVECQLYAAPSIAHFISVLLRETTVSTHEVSEWGLAKSISDIGVSGVLERSEHPEV